MSNIKSIIIDDEPIAIRILQNHLSVFAEVEIIACFSSAVDALNFLRINNVDLILCDIEMPRLTGIEFVKSLLNQPSVIFTTAHRNYALDAYDLDVVDYLLKPISKERLGRAIARYHKQSIKHQVNENNIPDTFINIKTSKEVVRLQTENILYVESFGDYIIVHHTNGRITSRERISNMEKSLPTSLFTRIHRCYIVSDNNIESIQGNVVVLNKQKLPIGRTYRDALKDKIKY